MSNWKVRVRPILLVPGDRIIFSAGMGGEGEVVTVESVSQALGTASIHTEELDFPIEVLTHNTVVLAA
jgi:hypothetical protein